MPVEGAEAYPLYWPDGWPRAKHRAHPAYKAAFGRARDDVLRTLRLMGVRSVDIVISTNIPLRRDGLPLAGMREPEDPGVAVYWSREGKPHVMACDRWVYARGNLRAIGAALDGLRAVARSGASHIVERAFLGFHALPAHATSGRKPWREVLGFPPKGRVMMRQVELAHRAIAMKVHPDRIGGSDELLREVNDAKADAERELAMPGGFE